METGVSDMASDNLYRVLSMIKRFMMVLCRGRVSGITEMSKNTKMIGENNINYSKIHDIDTFGDNQTLVMGGTFNMLSSITVNSLAQFSVAASIWMLKSQIKTIQSTLVQHIDSNSKSLRS